MPQLAREQLKRMKEEEKAKMSSGDAVLVAYSVTEIENTD